MLEPWPLLGVTVEELRAIADLPAVDDETTTETVVDYVLRQRTAPEGWADVATPLKDTPVAVTEEALGGSHSSHRYLQTATGAERTGEDPPPGTRSLAELIKSDRFFTVGTANRFVSHAWQLKFRRLVSALERSVKKERNAGMTREIYLWIDIMSLDQHRARQFTSSGVAPVLKIIGIPCC